MSDALVFPQPGDEGDAAFFAFLSGIGTQTSAIVNGLSVTADDSNLTIDVDRGKAVIVKASKDTVSDNIQPDKTLDIAAHSIQFTGQTDLSVADNTVNEIYLDPKFNQVNDPQIVIDPTATDTLLKIATVDTTGTGTGTGTGITVRDQWFLLSESGILSFPDNAALMDSIGSLSPSTLVRDRATDTLSVTTPSGLHKIPSVSEIDSTFADISSGGTEHPSYSTLSDVPETITEGDVVYIEDENRLYIEDGT
jgi:hypothetical protein